MNKVYSVKQINHYIKNIFFGDVVLSSVTITGEVSNLKYHTSGHIYFSLKDESSSISCVMFAGYRKGLSYPMKNGDKITACGSIEIYERDGKYQLYAKQIRASGQGELYQRFLALKEELSQMGMFDASYKLPIPKYSRRIGIVTAPAGAAIRDIENITTRRNPYVQLFLFPAIVQGEEAAPSICKGIKALDRFGVDVIIVGRGGGSLEDLWAFNEESVARAIFNCHTPVISAVGHETDFSISDMVADLRAPTPSAAAELAVFDCREYDMILSTYQDRLNLALDNELRFQKLRLEQIRKSLEALSCRSVIEQKQLYLQELKHRIYSSLQKTLLVNKGRLQALVSELKGLSPLERLSAGYSYVLDDAGHGISSVEQISAGEMLHIYVTDGIIRANVIELTCDTERAGKG